MSRHSERRRSIVARSLFRTFSRVGPLRGMLDIAGTRFAVSAVRSIFRIPLRLAATDFGADPPFPFHEHKVPYYLTD